MIKLPKYMEYYSVNYGREPTGIYIIS